MSDFSERPRRKESRNSGGVLILPPASLSGEVPPERISYSRQLIRGPEPKPNSTWEALGGSLQQNGHVLVKLENEWE